jgi:hypothetical protein
MGCFNEIAGTNNETLAASCRIRHLDRVSDLSLGQPAICGFPAAGIWNPPGLAHFIAMGFMLAAMIRPKAAEMDTSAILRSMVLLVPVLYSMGMPDTMLGNQAFKKRFIGTNNGAISRQAPSIFSLRNLKTIRTLRHHRKKQKAPRRNASGANHP